MNAYNFNNLINPLKCNQMTFEQFLSSFAKKKNKKSASKGPTEQARSLELHKQIKMQVC